MVSNHNNKISKLLRTALILVVTGIVLSLGGILFNWLTINDQNGANIGAGLIFLLGGLLFLCGLILLLVAFLKKK